MPKHTFSVQHNYLNERIIEFKNITHTIEFLKTLLQLLGMFNFILKTNQNIWQLNDIYAVLTAPNGLVMLHIDANKNISLEGFNNQKDITKIETILDRFVHFEKEALEVQVKY